MGMEVIGGKHDREVISMSCKAWYGTLLHLFPSGKSIFEMERVRLLYTGKDSY